jgi:hypothetical protein
MHVLQAEVLLEEVEVAVTMQRRMAVHDAEGGRETINCFARRACVHVNPNPFLLVSTLLTASRTLIDPCRPLLYAICSGYSFGTHMSEVGFACAGCERGLEAHTLDETHD